jgi:hypothetical protein
LRRTLLVPILAIIVAATLVSALLIWPYISPNNNDSAQPAFFFGVSFNGNTTADAEVLIDRVKGFTNLFVMQSYPVSINETALNEVLNYAVAADLYVIAAFGYFNPNITWQIPWLDYAKATWGNRFLGVYLNDEPGGQTIDTNWTGYFNQIQIRNTSRYYTHGDAIDLHLNGTSPVDNSQAAYHFLDSVQNGLGLQELKSRGIPAYTSDYALYWFDYAGGYDTIFAEFGSNQSIDQTIALVRGAARMQNKTWGVIITWTYTQPPYIVNGTELYSQLVQAYEAGAKYAVIFDYPQIGDNPYGILTEDQLSAMAQFWNDIPNLTVQPSPTVAFVMPNNYGWGMRTPNDLLWGLWPPDAASAQIWNTTRQLLKEYGSNFDIIYDDSRFPIQGQYERFYFWNQTL